MIFGTDTAILRSRLPDFRHTMSCGAVCKLRRPFCLARDLTLVFNVFWPTGLHPDRPRANIAEQMSRDHLSHSPKILCGTQQLPLELVAETPFYEYEKTPCPTAPCRPRLVRAGWITGLDVFDVTARMPTNGAGWLVPRPL